MSQAKNYIFHKVCRLCGHKKENGYELYPDASKLNEDHPDFVALIDKFLPIKISHDEIYLNWICVSCALNLESTAQFFNEVIAGQEIIKNLINQSRTTQQQSLLISQQPSEPPPKKKGRPRRLPPEVLAERQRRAEEEWWQKKAQEGAELPSRRRIKPPEKLKDTASLREIDDVLTKEGIELSDLSDDENEAQYCQSQSTLGQIRSREGKIFGDLIVQASEMNRKLVSYACDVCQVVFKHQNQLVDHQKSHIGVVFECRDCLEQFSDRLSLTIHQDSTGHSGQGIIEGFQPANSTPVEVSSLEFVCGICSRSFKERRLLKRHQIRHETDHPFACSICSFKFKTMEMLKSHEAKHNVVFLRRKNQITRTNPAESLKGESADLNSQPITSSEYFDIIDEKDLLKSEEFIFS